jgi:hypothetical protein
MSSASRVPVRLAARAASRRAAAGRNAKVAAHDESVVTSPRRLGWLPFEELVQAHAAWRHDPNEETEPAYRTTLASFERACGEIVDSYWCMKVPSAVALTEKRQAGWWRRIAHLAPELDFHLATDWATKDEPAVAELLHKCDDLAIRISRILRGPTRAIAMRLVTSSASHVLSLVDRPAEHRHPADRQQAIAYEREQVAKTERYYDEVGLRQAQLVYLVGMIGGAILIGALAWGIWATTGRDFSTRIVLAIVMGAAGAVLSVMQRMTNRKQGFELDYELGRTPLVVFGIFRPLLGAAFGLVLYAAIASGVVNLKLADTGNTQTYFYALLSFAAGWSERLAKDVLDAAETTVGTAVKSKYEPSPQ